MNLEDLLIKAHQQGYKAVDVYNEYKTEMHKEYYNYTNNLDWSKVDMVKIYELVHQEVLENLWERYKQ